MHNMPAAPVGVLAIDATSADGVVRAAMTCASVIGADPGPKITAIGSLATPLRLHVRSTKDTGSCHLRIGIVLTLPTLLVTLGALALRPSQERQSDGQHS